MAPKKATGTTTKKTSTSTHGSYKDMIKEAILSLKERNGSSRQAIKKYVIANNKIGQTGAAFDAQFNKAIKAGVEKGDFAQPKGASGPVKLAKKEAKPAVPKKTDGTKKATTKKAAPKKEKTEKKTTTKKAAAPKKAATKTKANTAKPRVKKAAKPADAPAVVDAPKVLTKTKSGRVAKTKADAPTTKKTATAKKPAAKKAATTKKASTPKKTEPTPAAA